MAGLFFDPAVPDAFWAKLDWSAKADGCWLWAPTSPNAYPTPPKFKNRNAARYLYQVQVRPLGTFESVVPSCMRKQCVNPDHMKVTSTAREEFVKKLAFNDRHRTDLNDLHELDPVVEVN